jgi:hypothetical protein
MSEDKLMHQVRLRSFITFKFFVILSLSLPLLYVLGLTHFSPVPIKNKFAQILVLLFKVEYPDVWPNFFAELFDALQLNRINHNGTELNESLVSMFLIIMDTIDQEVVSLEVERSPAEHAHNQLIVCHFAFFFFFLLLNPIKMFVVETESQL